MPKQAFRTVFWGLLLVFLDLRFNGFDILLDPLGYVIVVAGLSNVSTRAAGLGHAYQWAFALIFLSIASVFPQDPRFMGELGFVFAAGGFVAGLVCLFFIWTLCGGIAEWALRINRGPLADAAAFRRMIFAVLVATSMILSIVGLMLGGGRQYSLSGHPGLALLLLLAIPLFLIPMILLLHLIWWAGNEFDYAEPDGRRSPGTYDIRR